jgi:hypothetical protein
MALELMLDCKLPKPSDTTARTRLAYAREEFLREKRARERDYTPNIFKRAIDYCTSWYKK